MMVHDRKEGIRADGRSAPRPGLEGGATLEVPGDWGREGRKLDGGYLPTLNNTTGWRLQ